MSQMTNHGETETRRFIGISASPWLARILIWLLPLSFLTLAFFFPLTRILALTFDASTLTSQNLLLASRVLIFTFYQAADNNFFTQGFGSAKI